MKIYKELELKLSNKSSDIDLVEIYKNFENIKNYFQVQDMKMKDFCDTVDRIIDDSKIKNVDTTVKQFIKDIKNVANNQAKYMTIANNITTQTRYLKEYIDKMHPSVRQREFTELITLFNANIEKTEKNLKKVTDILSKLENTDVNNVDIDKLKNEIKDTIKPEIKSEIKPELKSELKPELKSELKPELKSEIKSELKEESVKPDVPVVKYFTNELHGYDFKPNHTLEAVSTIDDGWIFLSNTSLKEINNANEADKQLHTFILNDLNLQLMFNIKLSYTDGKTESIDILYVDVFGNMNKFADGKMLRKYKIERSNNDLILYINERPIYTKSINTVFDIIKTITMDPAKTMDSICKIY